MFLKQAISFLRFLPRPHTTLNSQFNLNLFNKNFVYCCTNGLLINRISVNFSNNFAQKRYLSSTQKEVSESKSRKPATEVTSNEEAEDDILYKTIKIEARSADRAVLDSYQQFVSMAATHLDINLDRVWEPFRTIQRRTLLRAAFVKKKYRVQYEWRTYYRCLEFKRLTGSTADTFLEYIERNLPEGVALKVTRERIEVIPPHLTPPSSTQHN